MEEDYKQRLVPCMNVDTTDEYEFLWVYSIPKDRFSKKGRIPITWEEYEHIEKYNCHPEDILADCGEEVTENDCTRNVQRVTKEILQRHNLIHIFNDRNIRSF